MKEVQIVFSAGGQFYAIPDIRREGGIWLSLARHPLPGLSFAVVMRGRDYWRVGLHAPTRPDGSRAVSIDDELVRDYRDACWWTPGLEEAWAEAEGLRLAMEEMAREAGKKDRGGKRG